MTLEDWRSLVITPINSRVDAAWHAYRWAPLADHSQATAWLRLLDFAAHLLDSTVDGGRPTAFDKAWLTERLQQWFQMIHLTPDDAIAWLIDPDNEPDPLLEMLMEAAIAEASNQVSDMAMLQAYSLKPVRQRIALVRQLRNTYALVDESLAGLPDWTMRDELPALHNLCAQEASHQALQPKLSEQR